MFRWLTEVADFMPHGMCLLWRPGLMALHIISDGLIAASYFAIPIAIAIFVRRRSDLDIQHKALALLFAIFIAACGTTHVMSIIVLWRPYYDLEGMIKAFTAVVSVATAMALPFLLPQLLRIPSPRVLAAEIAAHRTTLAELESARQALAERVFDTETDLRATTRRFEAALRGSQVTVAEQDADQRFTWIYNPPLGLDPSGMIGRTDATLFEPAGAVDLQTLTSRVLQSGEGARAEIRLAIADRAGWFDMSVDPILLEDDRPGVIVTAADITALKRHEAHLRVVMRELNHRSKNLLTIVMSLARQTARGVDVPAAFLERLQERLSSLAGAHDVLAQENWQGADLAAIVEGQLSHQIEAYGGRVTVDGRSCILPADAASYMAMALHELGSNAVKYGALSGDAGAVTITWRDEGPIGARTLKFEWVERNGPAVSTPARPGFGSTILTSLTPRALGGTATLDFAPGGLRWTLTAPMGPDPGSNALP